VPIGSIIGLPVPFLPDTARDTGMFEQPRAPGHDALARFERVMGVPVEIILFLFGLVNAGASRWAVRRTAGLYLMTPRRTA